MFVGSRRQYRATTADARSDFLIMVSNMQNICQGSKHMETDCTQVASSGRITHSTRIKPGWRVASKPTRQPTQQGFSAREPRLLVRLLVPERPYGRW